MQRCHACRRDVPEGALYCPFCREAILPAEAVSKRKDPFIGRTVDGIYLIREKIGAGGMGQVYKAVQTNLDRPVAIKILHAALALDENIVERFHLEARAASKLHHPNVIGIIDFGKTEDGTLFMVMELVPGRNLAAVLAEEFPLGERRAVYLATQVLGALSAAHAAGIVHRDIKPENILVESRDNEPDFVKVLDFGIAKIQESDSQHRITQTGAINGTPAFMSPEQISQQPLDARSDLYSTGVVLYEMLTSRRPFGGNTPLDMFRQHLYETPPPMAERMPAGCRISPSLEAIVRRALEKKPEDRFPTADAMRRALLECDLDPELEKPPGSRVSSGRELGLNIALGAARASTPHPSVPATPPARSRPEVPAEKRIPTVQLEEAAQVDPPGTQAVERPRKSHIGLIAVGAGSCLMFAAGVAYLAVRHKNAPPSSTIVQALSTPPEQAGPASPPATEVAVSVVVEKPEKPPAGDAQAPAEEKMPRQAPAEAVATLGADHPSADEKSKPPEGSDPATPSSVTPKPIARHISSETGKKSNPVLEVKDMLGLILVPAASSGEGILAVSAEPPGEVFVNGQDVGESPREMRILAGTYRVRVENAAFGKSVKTITVRAGGRAIWGAELSK